MRLIFLALLLCLPDLRAIAEPTASSAQPAPGLLCSATILAAAQARGVPATLMAAIARVESGRRDPGSGAIRPWPWTVNADGQGSFYDSKGQAITAVRGMLARGVHSLDVGCMQVNLQHHPTAFASLEQAFDPAANADYAARFLADLHTQSGSWLRAAALYHSTTPELAVAYQRKVMSDWPEEARLTSTSPLLLALGPGAILSPGLLPPPRRDAGPHGVPRVAAPTGTTPQGRGLAAYRAAPIFPGWRRSGG